MLTEFFPSSMLDSSIIARNENIFYIDEGQVSITFLASHIRYSIYTVATIFFQWWIVKFSRSVQNGTVAKDWHDAVYFLLYDTND